MTCSPLQALCLPARGMLALVGAGGKTTLMYRLARELARHGSKVICTTTTHIFPPTPEQADSLVLTSQSSSYIDTCKECLENHHVVVLAGGHAPEGKLMGLDKAAVDALYAADICHWVLVEADGARRLSLKVPADHEPVIPSTSTHVLAVAGLTPLGHPLHPDWVCRSERYGKLTGLAPGETITPHSLALVAGHPEGLLKGTPEGAVPLLWLNQADSMELRLAGREVANFVRHQTATSGPKRIFLGSAALEDAQVETFAARESNVRGVILAAGLGQRMERTKQLLPFKGKPLLQHVVDAALASRLGHVLLVLGHEHQRICEQLDVQGITVAYNKDYGRGQSSSVQAGLQEGPEADGIMYLLGDQPLVTSLVIDSLLERFATVDNPWAVVPQYDGSWGNPVIIGRPLFKALEGLKGDCGPRYLLRANQSKLTFWETGDASVVRDIDSRDEYEDLLKNQGGE